MSQSQPNTTSTAYFQSIFNCALKAYKQKTKKDLATHPLATQLQSCNSASAILAILQGQVHKFDQSRESDKRWEKWLGPMVNVLYAFSATLGEGVGLAFSPAKVIFAGIGVLLIAAKDVNGSKDALASLFERIEHFFKRLETYTEVPPTSAMTDIIIKIMVEVLDILAIATKEMKEGSAKKYLKKLLEGQISKMR
ncbi:hypothetical protein B0F90DRAFT_288393 [Multifurca ochricompacta]|uniref:Fungal STAND N-terminal Goodbye domain-containing protein n=1 Tax=Multifurca ochricompacta TaxID=376703 RepID=A0AAD4M5Z7_9AGAM|nr:hypothetical protein B0F90DRAFT_288393 [Multifurca ochricompacta]